MRLKLINVIHLIEYIRKISNEHTKKTLGH